MYEALQYPGALAPNQGTAAPAPALAPPPTESVMKRYYDALRAVGAMPPDRAQYTPSAADERELAKRRMMTSFMNMGAAMGGSQPYVDPQAQYDAELERRQGKLDTQYTADTLRANAIRDALPKDYTTYLLTQASDGDFKGSFGDWMLEKKKRDQTPPIALQMAEALGLKAGTPEYKKFIEEQAQRGLPGSQGLGAVGSPVTNAQGEIGLITYDPKANKVAFVGSGQNRYIEPAEIVAKASEAALSTANSAAGSIARMHGARDRIAAIPPEVWNSGWSGQLGEAWKRATGTADAESFAKMMGEGVITEQVLASLPPGSASDTDIALARGGVPPQGSPQQMYLDYFAAVERVSAAVEKFNRFKYRYLGSNPTTAGLTGLGTAWDAAVEQEKQQKQQQAGQGTIVQPPPPAGHSEVPG